jgi:hypothetical protein
MLCTRTFYAVDFNIIKTNLAGLRIQETLFYSQSLWPGDGRPLISPKQTTDKPTTAVSLQVQVYKNICFNAWNCTIYSVKFKHHVYLNISQFLLPELKFGEKHIFPYFNVKQDLFHLPFNKQTNF